ncbi:hypothetical protein [Streptomyces violascens]|uniref:hypothetical protein n=1 Tax=Streptomyces violascens TaxID=67381 RepID=UPI0036BED7C5
MAGSQFQAYNSALSTTTNIDGGTSYASGAKVALQLGIPANGQIALVEWSVSLAGVQTTAAVLEVASTATASTMSTAHTTTTVFPAIDNYTLSTSRLTMSTTATGFGNGAITSNTTLRPVDRQQVFSAYAKIWPLEDYPRFGGSSAQYLQFRINTAATVNAIIYARWIELI